MEHSLHKKEIWFCSNKKLEKHQPFAVLCDIEKRERQAAE